MTERVIAAIVLALLAACPPATAPTGADASDASPGARGDAAAAACANLARLGCAIGLDPACVGVFTRAPTSGRTTDRAVACAARAGDRAAARHCDPDYVVCP